jgi:site-specific recombinase XerD
MILLTFYGGLRIAELCTIKPYDFNWEGWLRAPDELGRLKVIGKGNKQRPVFVPSKLMARIYTWIKNEVSHSQSKDASLFRISPRRWESIIERASQISIGRRISPHNLRHSCGTWLSENGFSLQEISEYLGHSSVSTTQIYVHLSQEKMKDKYQGLMK